MAVDELDVVSEVMRGLSTRRPRIRRWRHLCAAICHASCDSRPGLLGRLGAPTIRPAAPAWLKHRWGIDCTSNGGGVWLELPHHQRGGQHGCHLDLWWVEPQRLESHVRGRDVCLRVQVRRGVKCTCTLGIRLQGTPQWSAGWNSEGWYNGAGDSNSATPIDDPLESEVHLRHRSPPTRHPPTGCRLKLRGVERNNGAGDSNSATPIDAPLESEVHLYHRSPPTRHPPTGCRLELRGWNNGAGDSNSATAIDAPLESEVHLRHRSPPTRHPPTGAG
ncbi:uncharacterized protein LOC144160694 [Haemaphysalis longicornis]